MAIILFLTVTVILGVFFYHWRRTRSHLYTTVEKYFNGPKPTPFLGNAFEFLTNSQGIFEKVMQFSRENERFFRVWLGLDAFVVLYDPKDVEVLLSSNFHITKSDVYRFTLPWIGYGLLTSTGSKWKSRRRILTPTFHFKILEDFVEIFEANGQIFVEKLREKANKTTFNVYPYANLYALDNICETAMGTRIDAQKNSESSYVRAIKSMCNIVNMRAFRPWLMSDFIFNMSKYGAQQREALEILHKTTRNTIRSRREDFQRRKLNKESAENDDGLSISLRDFTDARKRLAFLDLLLESAEGSALSDADIQEEVDTFMFEGHDTVTSGISFTIYALSKNPEIQEKVYQEQKEIFGDSNRPATYKDYNDMKYLERVIKEAQRIFPSVPIIGRQIEQDLPLEGGVVLPKGCQAFVLMPALHKNEKIWPDPEKFDPDRFLLENSAERNQYAYVPFSAGPRNCIGQKFAYMELKASVSKIVRNFKIIGCDVEDEPKLVAELVYISSNGVNVRLEERT